MAFRVARGARPLLALLALAAVMPAACLSGESGPEGKRKVGATLTGEECVGDDDCFGKACLTTEFVSGILGSPAEIPAGYCSALGCVKNVSEGEDCGPNGYCFDLAEQGIPLGVCGRVCEDHTDCRNGYFCTDGAGPFSSPLPRKVCLPPDLICALDIPIETCPNVGLPDAGGGVKTCASNADCAAGQVCTNADGPNNEPLASAICLPNDLVCALGAPECPDAGVPTGDASAD